MKTALKESYSPSEVHSLEKGEVVHCRICMGENNFNIYKKKEAFLAGPDHLPYDGDANYICLAHLEVDAVITHEEEEYSILEFKSKFNIEERER